jgi:transglutaminase-like putative cysteine protease
MKEIEEVEEQEPWWKGPLKYILGIFLVLMLILWFIPYYAVRLDPEPKDIPKLKDIVPVGNETISGNRTYISHNDYPNLVIPNPFVKQVADKVVTQSCDSGRICHAKALYYFVRDNLQYVSDPLAYEYVKSASESLLSQGGDCDDASVLLANLEEAVGIKTRFVFIPRHVYIQIYLPEARRYADNDGWVSLDATCNYCDFGEIPYKNIDAQKTVV